MAKVIDRPTALRRALLLDSAASGTMGLLLLLAAGALQPMLGLPLGLLRWTGVVLIPFAALLVAVAVSARVSRSVILAVVAANVLWVLGSLLLLLSGSLAPTTLGKSFILGQAVAVAVFVSGTRRTAARPFCDRVRKRALRAGVCRLCQLA